MPTKTSGQGAFTFALRDDLYSLPAKAREFETKLHGGFAIDRTGDGDLYYGMPGCGIMRIEADLSRQDVIPLPDELRPMNFHSTKIGEFDGKRRLFLPANEDERVVVMDLDGEIEYVLPRPEFEQYRDASAPYNPTDTALVDDVLYIADGYGSNHISSVDVRSRAWKAIFGGKAEDAEDDGRFKTAHGLNLNPVHRHLDICDRPSSRIQAHAVDGGFVGSHKLPKGAWPCGINYLEKEDRWFAVIGCLNDPDKESEGRPAPIYILDAETYELLSTIRPKEELGVEDAVHLHNVVLHVHGGTMFLVCQSWNPGHYFVLQQV